MNTEAQLTVSLTPDQVRGRLTQLAQRAFKSAADDAELDLLVSVITGAATTFTISGNVWSTVLRHHDYGFVPFDETDGSTELQQCHVEASTIFRRLAATADSQAISDGFTFDPGENEEFANYDAFKALLKRGGEIASYTCEAYPFEGRDIVEALSPYGETLTRGHFAGQWLYHPADLGYALASHGLGKGVRSMRSISLAILAAAERHDSASSDDEASAQSDVIGLLWPLLKAMVFAGATLDNSPAVSITENDGTLALVEEALTRGLIAGRSCYDRLDFRGAQSDGANQALSTPTSQLVEAFRSRVHR